MREGWTYKKLGEICSCITKGTTPTSLGFSFEEQGISFVKVESFTEEGSLLKDKVAFISEECNNALKRSQLEEDDILFSIAGAIGRVAIVPKDILPANTNQALAIVRLREKEKLTLLYLKYLLSSSYIKHQTNFYKAGVAQQNLSLGQLSSLQIPLPPKSQQEAIVSELDEINSLLALKREQLQKYDKLAQSLFYEMFGDPVENEKGWEVKKFIDVVKLQRGFDLPTNLRVSSGNIPVYGSNGVLGFHNESKIDSGIITGRSGTIGEVFVSHTPCWPLNTSLFSVDTHGNNLVYLQYLLRAYDLKRFVEGAGVPTLNRNVFHNNLIIDCPLPLQQQFASRIEQIESQKQQVQAAIEKLETLLASRMQYWFE